MPRAGASTACTAQAGISGGGGGGGVPGPWANVTSNTWVANGAVDLDGLGLELPSLKALDGLELELASLKASLKALDGLQLQLPSLKALDGLDAIPCLALVEPVEMLLEPLEPSG